MTRYTVNFARAFRGDAAPCIAHETVDKVKTLCGRLVADAITCEPDENDLEPDCLVCARKAQKLKAQRAAAETPTP